MEKAILIIQQNLTELGFSISKEEIKAEYKYSYQPHCNISILILIVTQNLINQE